MEHRDTRFFRWYLEINPERNNECFWAKYPVHSKEHVSKLIMSVSMFFLPTSVTQEKEHQFLRSICYFPENPELYQIFEANPKVYENTEDHQSWFRSNRSSAARELILECPN
jgi:hypothetical protein